MNRDVLRVDFGKTKGSNHKMRSASGVDCVAADWSATWQLLVGVIHHACGGPMLVVAWAESMVHVVDQLYNPEGVSNFGHPERIEQHR